MASIQPYQISVPQAKLDLLYQKLRLTTLPDELDDSGRAYGSPLADIKRLHAHWSNSYDWRAAEKRLNATIPQFTTTIDTAGHGPLTIHFVHQRSANPNAIPLLFSHGWPGSFLEVSKLLPLLAAGAPGAPAFHIVAPSLPGYGFSQGASRPGFGCAQMADVCDALMQRLGYAAYATQGGDWGSWITRLMGARHPAHCRASHINMPYPTAPTLAAHPLLAARDTLLGFSPQEKAGFARGEWFVKEGYGYNKQQSTRPQTLGYAMADSPVGLLAWIYEKLVDWTDGYPWTDDEVITWVMIYWCSLAGPTAASRIYYEATHSGREDMKVARGYIPHVKLGVTMLPKELSPVPLRWLPTLGNLVFAAAHDHGGHFAAWEHPEVLVGDLYKMFGKGGGAYGAVEGKTGYAAAGTPRL